MHMQVREQFGSTLTAGFPIDSLPQCYRLITEGNIFRNGQFRKKSRLLIDRSDPERLGKTRRILLQELPVDEDSAFIWFYRSGDYLDERRFACAILADERMHLTCAEFERDTTQSVDTVIALTDIDKRNESGGIHMSRGSK